jgi:hypothetical protein
VTWTPYSASLVCRNETQLAKLDARLRELMPPPVYNALHLKA